MNASSVEMVARVARICENLDVVRAALAGGVLSRMAEARRSPVATARADRIVTAGGRSDPTARAALGSADLAAAHLAELVQQLARIHRAADRLRVLVERYPPAAELDPATRALLEAPEPGCGNCATVAGPRGAPRWEPIDSRLANPVALPDGTVAWLCRWCYDQLGRWGRLPNAAELRIHHAGGRVRWPADVPHPVTGRAVRSHHR